MPILFRVERNNLNTQCIMKYRFLVTNREGERDFFELVLERDADAKKMASIIIRGIRWIRDITVHRLLTEDSCGPIYFIVTIDRDDL